MKMCKYCGGIIKDAGMGPREAYCKPECVDAVFGFDNQLKSERQHGKVSLDAFRRVGEKYRTRELGRNRCLIRLTEMNPFRVRVICALKN